MNIEYLHIYGQYAWHDDVQIVGTRSALEQLHTIIGAALKGEVKPDGAFFCGDGEGYDVIVVVRDDEDAWPRYRSPYEADYAQDQQATIDPI